MQQITNGLQTTLNIILTKDPVRTVPAATDMEKVSPKAKKIWGIRLLLFFPYAFVMYRYYRYKISDNAITILKGFFIRRSYFIPKSSVEFTELFQSPLQKHYKVYTLYFHLAGSVKSISNLEIEEIRKIRQSVNA